MKDKRKVFILLFLLVLTSIIATVEVIGTFIVEIPGVRADRAGAILLIVNWLFTCFFVYVELS